MLNGHTWEILAAERGWHNTVVGRRAIRVGSLDRARVYREPDQTVVVRFNEYGEILWRCPIPDGVPVAVLAAAMAEAETP